MGKTFSEVRLQSLGEGNYDMGEMEGIKKIRQTRNEMDGQFKNTNELWNTMSKFEQF